MVTSQSAAKWSERSSLTSRDAIETRIRELVAQYFDGERTGDLITQVEVLVAAAFVDPIASTRRGNMTLSRALLTYSNTTPDEFKKFFGIRDYGHNFEEAYDLAIEVVGANVALALMEDVLKITGDPIKAAMLAIQRMVSPTSRYRRFADVARQRQSESSAVA